MAQVHCNNIVTASFQLIYIAPFQTILYHREPSDLTIILRPGPRQGQPEAAGDDHPLQGHEPWVGEGGVVEGQQGQDRGVPGQDEASAGNSNIVAKLSQCSYNAFSSSPRVTTGSRRIEAKAREHEAGIRRSPQLHHVPELGQRREKEQIELYEDCKFVTTPFSRIKQCIENYFTSWRVCRIKTNRIQRMCNASTKFLRGRQISSASSVCVTLLRALRR